MISLPPLVRLAYRLNAEAIRARRTREALGLAGRTLRDLSPDELLFLLLAEGMPEGEAQRQATEHAAALLRADSAAKAEG